jgi:hypothetical protein
MGIRLGSCRLDAASQLAPWAQWDEQVIYRGAGREVWG